MTTESERKDKLKTLLEYIQSIKVEDALRDLIESQHPSDEDIEIGKLFLIESAYIVAFDYLGLGFSVDSRGLFEFLKWANFVCTGRKTDILDAFYVIAAKKAGGPQMLDSDYQTARNNTYCAMHGRDRKQGLCMLYMTIATRILENGPQYVYSF